MPPGAAAELVNIGATGAENVSAELATAPEIPALATTAIDAIIEKKMEIRDLIKIMVKD
jgi:hypothetical protein